MTLRLVHPRPEGQPPRPPGARRRRPCSSLTAEETRHLRATLKNLARAYGSWACLAEVMGVTAKVLQRSRGLAHPGIAIRAARAAGMSVEAVISGQLSAAGRCTSCGSRAGHKPATRAS